MNKFHTQEKIIPAMNNPNYGTLPSAGRRPSARDPGILQTRELRAALLLCLCATVPRSWCPRGISTKARRRRPRGTFLCTGEHEGVMRGP
eukprot:1182221-Prorocentrum_minimum.AAC.3